MQIVTGYTGTNHVTSKMDGCIYRGIIGPDKYVLNQGNKLSFARVGSTNQVVIQDGTASIQGRCGIIEVNQPETLTHANGQTGYNRIDLGVIRLSRGTNGIEKMTLTIIKGVPVVTGTTPVDPAYETGAFDNGSDVTDMPIYRITFNGLAVSGTDDLRVFAPSIADLSTTGTGGRNYLTGTKDLINNGKTLAYNSTLFSRTVDADGDGVVALLPFTVATSLTILTDKDATDNPWEGKDVILSCDMKASNLADNNYYNMYLDIYGSNDLSTWTRKYYSLLYLVSPSYFNVKDYKNNEWVRVIHKRTFPSVSKMTESTTANFTYYRYAIQLSESTQTPSGATCSYRLPKLELATVPSDWSPSPQDGENSLNSVKTAFNGKVIWTNGAPSSTMVNGQVLTLSDSLANYDAIEVSWIASLTDPKTFIDRYDAATGGLNLSNSYGGASGVLTTSRQFARTSNTVLTSQDGYTYAASTRTANTSVCIPLEIRGYKRP